MNEFLKNHFDKLLLSTLFLISFGVLVHFTRSIEFYATAATASHLANVTNWLENTVGQILAALLTLMVGRNLTASATATPGGGVHAETGTPPAAPEASTPTEGKLGPLK